MLLLLSLLHDSATPDSRSRSSASALRPFGLPSHTPDRVDSGGEYLGPMGPRDPYIRLTGLSEVLKNATWLGAIYCDEKSKKSDFWQKNSNFSKIDPNGAETCSECQIRPNPTKYHHFSCQVFRFK